MSEQDDGAKDFDADEDTAVDLDPDDLAEIEELTPARPTDFLRGYELGRRDERLEIFAKLEPLQWHRGAAAVLHAVRDEFESQTRDRAFADEFMRRMARKVGVRLG